MNDIIRTAIDKHGEFVHIDHASGGQRYQGLGAHDGCVLYPVYRDRKQSSLAHLPNRARCAAPTGESIEHKRTKEEWAEYLSGYLNLCRGCSPWGAAAPNLHLSTCRRPFFADIAWFCNMCLRGHLFELPDSADDVVTEKARFGGAVRPDVTVIDGEGRPLVFLEFNRSHLSPRIEAIAQQHGISLFVIDVLSGNNQRQRLYNPEYRWYDGVDGLDARTKQMMRSSDTFPGSSFSVLPDENGNAVPTLRHVPDHDGEPISHPMPSPHFGYYLLADRSTLACDSQQKWLDEAALPTHPTRA